MLRIITIVRMMLAKGQLYKHHCSAVTM